VATGQRFHHPVSPAIIASPRRVVFVSLVFYPDSSASSILFTDLFRQLVDETGITVLCGFPTKDIGVDVSLLPRRETLDGIEIVRCGVRIQGKRSILTRAVAYVSFLVHAGWRLLRLECRARVVGGTDPPFTSIALWVLSRLGRLEYECILLDVYPDGLIGLGALSASSTIAWVWRALNRLSYRGAVRLDVIGRDMVTLLERRYDVDPRKTVYIPHWGAMEVDAMEVADRSPLIERLGLQGKFVVQYSGNMGLWHDMESFVHAADRVRDDDRIQFLFIGKGMRRAGAERLAQTLGLTNITWMDFLPREQLAQGLASCDAALISLRQGLQGVAVPSKLYGILASGRAVVAQVPRNSEVAYVVEEERCGVVVDPGDVAGLAGAIRLLASDGELTRQMGERARAAYRAKYTLDHAAHAFKSLWHTS